MVESPSSHHSRPKIPLNGAAHRSITCRIDGLLAAEGRYANDDLHQGQGLGFGKLMLLAMSRLQSTAGHDAALRAWGFKLCAGSGVQGVGYRAYVREANVVGDV